MEIGNVMKNKIVRIWLFTLFAGIFFLGCNSTKKQTPHQLIREKDYDAAMSGVHVLPSAEYSSVAWSK